MKKLITTAMALALVAGFASAQVVSDNIVGYITITNPATGSLYPSFGNCFITVGSAATQITLGEIVADGMEAGIDYLQFLSSTDLATTMTATYIDAATAVDLGDPELQGWWNLAIDTSLDDTVLVAGTGFIGNFSSGNAITLTLSGEVVQDAITLDLTGKAYPMLANTVPADLTLGDITADGMEAGIDYLQFLSPADLATTITATYIDAATADALGDPELQGWWNLAIDTSLDSTPLPAGVGFLGNISSGNAVTITFPNPLAP